jgi:SagB-type dehydrogenase family enzyme
MDLIHANREFMKSPFATTAFGVSDQSKGLPQPPLELPHDPAARVTPLPAPDPGHIVKADFHQCLLHRRSRRHWTGEPISAEQLGFLLWATQGVEEVLGDDYATLRPAASGGARHTFETYLVLNHVTGIAPGVYRYLPLSHALVFLFTAPDMAEKVSEATFGQRFVASAAVAFFWSAIPYRGEWRYTTAAHKVMLIDAGHMCQNLYLACEALGLGTCAVGAYDQKAIDAFLHLDGKDEFVIYLAPVGKI